MGPSGSNQTDGVNISANNSLVEYNPIDSMGNIGLFFSGNDVIIKNNEIGYFTRNKDGDKGIFSVEGDTPRL